MSESFLCPPQESFPQADLTSSPFRLPGTGREAQATFPNPRSRRKAFLPCCAIGSPGTRFFMVYTRTGLDLNAWDNSPKYTLHFSSGSDLSGPFSALTSGTFSSDYGGETNKSLICWHPQISTLHLTLKSASWRVYDFFSHFSFFFFLFLNSLSCFLTIIPCTWFSPSQKQNKTKPNPRCEKIKDVEIWTFSNQNHMFQMHGAGRQPPL